MTNAWEIKNFLESRGQHLHISGIDAVDLARKYGTPLFVYSEERIRHNINRLKQAGREIVCTLRLCYAAKAMSTMGILRAVRDAGCYTEVNSGGELWKALKAGFSGEQIIFNGTSKEVWELEMAISEGIYAIQVDSPFELSLIEETARKLGKRANVSLRLVPEIESDTHSGLQTALLTSKFGMMPEEAYKAFREFRDSPHLNLSGIHLHIGSQNPDPGVYSEALAVLFQSLIHIYQTTGERLEHVNMGGGFPVNYLRGASGESVFSGKRRDLFSADFEPAPAIFEAWKHALAAQRGSRDLFENITLLLEPGRSIISDAGICLTTVRNRKQRPVAKVGSKRQVSEAENDVWLLTDAGFNILLSMETYKWYYHLISAERAGEPHNTEYKLAGPLCDGGDVYFDIEGCGRLPDHRLLPDGVEPGEILALLNCGAYSMAQASQYNGRFLPAVVLINTDGKAELIRKRDGFDDLIRNDLF